MTDTHCTDGASNEEHDTMLTMTGQCPWCGMTTAEEARLEGPARLAEDIALLIIRANRTGPQGMGMPFRSILTGICTALLAIRHDLTKEVI